MDQAQTLRQRVGEADSEFGTGEFKVFFHNLEESHLAERVASIVQKKINRSCEISSGDSNQSGLHIVLCSPENLKIKKVYSKAVEIHKNTWSRRLGIVVNNVTSSKDFSNWLQKLQRILWENLEMELVLLGHCRSRENLLELEIEPASRFEQVFPAV